MRKHPYIKRLLPLFLGVLLLFIDILPLYSQSSLNACFTSPAAASECASAGLISPQSAANAVRGALVNPSPINPFINIALPSKELVLVVGGVAALAYLRPSDMQKLKDNAPTSKQYSNGRWRAKNFVSGVATGWLNDVTPDRIENFNSGGYSVPNIFYKYGVSSLNWPGQVIGDVWGSQTYGQVDFEADTSAGTSAPTFAPDTSKVSDFAIYAAAATAAAAAARDAAGRKDVRSAVAASAAAAAAAGLVPAGSPDKAAADSAAVAAAAAAADASDPTKAPDTPQAQPIYFTQVNFLAYAVSSSGFGNKFPFGMFAPLPAGAAMACPTFTSWGRTVELCFIRDIIMLIKYIVWVRFAIYSFVNL